MKTAPFITAKSPHGPRFKLEYVHIDALETDTTNARVHSPAQISAIGRSIGTFGFVTPIVADHKVGPAGKRRIRIGNGRWQAAKAAGIKTVPVILLDHLDDAQLRALAIADNRLTDLSEWDNRTLARQLRELSELKLDFSIEVTGFSITEIDVRIQSVADGLGTANDAADELPDESDAAPTSRLGDIWHLDDHRVLCGDSLDRTCFDRLLGAQKAEMVFTDQPYNVRISGHVCGKGKKKHREFAMASGEMSVAAFTQFLETSCGLMVEYSCPGSIHFLCMDWRHLPEILTAVKSSCSAMINLCVWVKPNGGRGSFYKSQHELIVVAKSGTSAHIDNVQLGRFGRNRTNVWSYAGPNNFGREGPEGNLAALHPTVKPVGLIADAILDASTRGGIILDPFLGSGSTVIAAHRTGRRCYGIEIDPRYVDTVVHRWERFTGKVARHANGKSFAQISTKRGISNV